jgi:hypothetical protein
MNEAVFAILVIFEVITLITRTMHYPIPEKSREDILRTHAFGWMAVGSVYLIWSIFQFGDTVAMTSSPFLAVVFMGANAIVAKTLSVRHNSPRIKPERNALLLSDK